MQLKLHCTSEERGFQRMKERVLNPLNAELNPICHLLALLGAYHILYVSRTRVNRSCLVWMVA